MGNSPRRNDRSRISRRVMLTTAALSLGAATAATVVLQAAAQTKLSQADAKYQTTPSGDHRCEGCANFHPPNGCKFVQGDISPNGWCRFYAKKS